LVIHPVVDEAHDVEKDKGDDNDAHDGGAGQDRTRRVERFRWSNPHPEATDVATGLLGPKKVPS
jgi:hypothetical protein